MAVRMLKSGPDPLPGWDGVTGTIETTYEGAVLSTGERNFRDDSDFYAKVWDETTGTVKTVEYATTRGWTYANSADVDATPEVRAKAARFFTILTLASLKAKAAEAAPLSRFSHSAPPSVTAASSSQPVTAHAVLPNSTGTPASAQANAHAAARRNRRGKRGGVAIEEPVFILVWPVNPCSRRRPARVLTPMSIRRGNRRE